MLSKILVKEIESEVLWMGEGDMVEGGKNILDRLRWACFWA